MTWNELYWDIMYRKQKGESIEELEERLSDADRSHMDCLLHPEKHAVVWNVKDCDCTGQDCVAACIFQAMEVRDGKVSLNPEKCTGCAECIEACQNESLDFSKDTVRVLELLKEAQEPVYALVAPAFVGQFGREASPARIRTALKQIGFAGMIEVAAFADILTLKESLEFKENLDKPGGFQLTSCCCPVWIALIRRDFQKIAGHLPPSVSPMIACGRIVKELHRDCKTVFIGPCLAKKAEAREKGLEGAIDCVLTFQELEDLFQVFQIDFSRLDEDSKEHAAAAGRLYARSGGVSRAIRECVDSLGHHCEMKPVYANGVEQCKELLGHILQGEIEGNFYEGMACPGGCVGGPKRLKDVEEGTQMVNEYAAQASYATPGENPYVIDLIQRLGFDTVEHFLEGSRILTREL